MLEGYKSNFQQQKHYPNKIMKPAEEDWDQSNLRLANYTQNSDQILLLKSPADLSRLGTGLVRSTQKTSQNLSLSFQLLFLSYETPNWMKHGHKGHLNTRNIFLKEVFPSLKISLLILD
jgi:hypothetical protein